MSSPFAPAKPIERSLFRVLLMRVGLAIAIAGQIGGVCGILYCAAHGLETWAFACFWILFPSIGFVVMTAASCAAYFFDYSLLGRLEPASPPPTWVAATTAYSTVRVGGFHASYPLFRCSIGPGGVLVKLLISPGWPEVFIASTQIVSITNDFFGRGLIEHTSPEIRSPILVSRRVVSEMYRCMPELALVRS